MKHHYGTLPPNFSQNIMPNFYINQLENKISRISLDQMYNYKYAPKITNIPFKESCIKWWNSLPFKIKSLPYTSSRHTLYKNFDDDVPDS